MSSRLLSVAVAILLLVAMPALGQTDTPTPEDTATPTHTPTPTHTNTPTHTFTPDFRDLTPVPGAVRAQRFVLLDQYDPALKAAGLAGWVESLERAVDRLGASVRQAVVPGLNGATPTPLPQPRNVARVHSILAITTADGSAAAKLLLGEGSSADYTVSGGIITLRSNQSANTLIITYEPSGS